MDSSAFDRERFLGLFDADIKRWDAGPNPPSRSSVVEVATELGCVFPADYVDFQCAFGAMYVEALEESWPRPEVGHVAPYWTMIYGFSVVGVGDGAPDWLEIGAVTEEFREDLADDSPSKELVPFLTGEGEADYLCFDANGHIYQWSHEEPDEPERYGGSFQDAVLEKLAWLVASKEAIRLARERFGDEWINRAEYPEKAVAELLRSLGATPRG